MQTEQQRGTIRREPRAPQMSRACAALRPYSARHARTGGRAAPGRAPARQTRPAPRRRKRRKRAPWLGVCLALCLLLAGVLWAAARAKPPAPQLEAPEPDAVPAAIIPAGGPPYTVAIDAGHGGVDVGAQGLVEESWMTETTVGFLEDWLTRDENYTPVRTHAYDTFLENAGRAAAANDARAALLLSVHGNSNPSSAETYGFECYAQTPGRRYHSASLYFAHLIADRFSAAGQRLRGEAGVRYIYYVGDDASGYEKQVIEESDDTVREEQSFGILEKTNCPAVLAEQCFVTSSADVDAWGTEAGCRRAARLYYEAICAYFDTTPLEDVG